MKYRDPNTGELKDLYVKTSDTLPIGTVVDYDGDTVPDGYEEVNTSYKTLANGYLYRKIGDDVEINVKLTGVSTTLPNNLTTIGTLPEGYRPKENIYVPVYAVNTTNSFLAIRLIIQTDGTVSLQQISGASVTFTVLSTFVRFSTL